jgi:hypothetical protein
VHKTFFYATPTAFRQMVNLESAIESTDSRGERESSRLFDSSPVKCVRVFSSYDRTTHEINKTFAILSLTLSQSGAGRFSRDNREKEQTKEVAFASLLIYFQTNLLNNSKRDKQNNTRP